MQNYGEKDYWDSRYLKQKNQTFDWLEDFSSLKNLIEKYISKDSKILMLGCGNSVLSEELYQNGYTDIVNIDISSVVISQMKDRCDIQYPKMSWHVMDVLDMQLGDSSFDVIFDKSTVDAILCGDMSFYNTAVMMNEVQRVLKTKGVYFCVSYGQPESRICHFNREHLSFDINCYMMSTSINL
jgi:ubiquinone/menaquinone biosynthesis C-methylase UbiE